MQAGFPVERLVRLASSPFQMGFARQALRLLESSDAIAFEATREGLLMRSQDEDALARPAALLSEVFGEQLVLLPPRVHYRMLGNCMHEPVMILRVRCAERYRDTVRDDLRAREATLLEEHNRRGMSVLRADAPLRRLLGYSAALALLSANTGRHWIWLDRYVPAGPPPGGSAA